MQKISGTARENVRAHLELMAAQKLTNEMDEWGKQVADYEGAYNEFVTCARAALAAIPRGADATRIRNS